jgi:tetratricopeptide (TPR) repeat protein
MATRQRKRLKSTGQPGQPTAPAPRPSDDFARTAGRDQADQRSLLASLALLSVLAFLPYWQVVGFEFLNFDDPLHVSKQPAVLAGLSGDTLRWALTATPTNLWHPVTWWSFMLEVEWLGGGADAPGVHHIGNALLHVANAVLFMLLLYTLRIRLPIAFAAALLFAMHPLHVEPVAWISARKDLLSGFFSLVALVAYARYRAAAQPHIGWWLLCFGAALAAMASKPAAVVLPFLLIVLDFVPAGPDRKARALTAALSRLLIEKWPFIAMAVGLAVVSIVAQYGGSLASDIGQQGLLSRLSEIPAKLAFYLQRVIWPVGLNFEYARPEGQRFLLLSLIGLAFLAAAAWILLTQAFKHPALWAALAWFLLCLSPMLGVIYVGGDFTTDRYTYLALAGPFLGLALWIETLPRLAWQAAVGVSLLLGATFGWASERQVGAWENDLALFSRGVVVQPRSALAHTNLAGVYRLEGDDELALKHYQQALGLDGSNYIIQYNIAQINRKQGDLPAAITALRASLDSHANYARSLSLLGELLDVQAYTAGKPLPADALQHRRKAYAIEPDQYRYAVGYAKGLANRGRFDEATRVLNTLVQSGRLTAKEQRDVDALLRRFP